MAIPRQRYVVAYIYGPYLLIYLSVLMIFLINLWFRALDQQLFPMTILIVLNLLYLVRLWVKYFIIRQKPAELALYTESLCLYGEEITADQIDKIIIKGYFIQKVGIKLRNKRGVQYKHCFRIVGDDDKVIHDIQEWCTRREVKVERGGFTVRY